MTRASSAGRRLALCCACALLAGCAAFATKGDYADYRAVRTEPSDEARLRAMQRYVTRHPDGRWYAEVQQERKQRDRNVFERGRSDRAGLELYLAAFPDGDFAAQARSRLAAIALIEQRKRGESALAARMADERRLRDEELSRTWVTRFFGYWMKTALGLSSWGSPIEQVARGNPDFSRAFGRPPRPRCTTEECVKYYESPYAVPVPGGTRVERTMRLVLRLRLREGRLVAAELLLPGSGFSRWQELEERRVVPDGDAEARAKAMEWAVARVLPLLDALAPGHERIAGYTLAQVPKLSFSPTGELTDTTAEDPAAPANRIQGAAAAQPELTPEELVKPVAPEQPADIEMEALRVGRDGQTSPTGQGASAPPAPAVTPAPPGGQAEMVLDPLAVPTKDGAPGAQPSAVAPAAQPAATAPAAPALAAPAPVAVRAAGFRVVVFAASASDPGALDGVLIEREIKPPAVRKRPVQPPKAAPPKP